MLNSTVKLRINQFLYLAISSKPTIGWFQTLAEAVYAALSNARFMALVNTVITTLQARKTVPAVGLHNRLPPVNGYFRNVYRLNIQGPTSQKLEEIEEAGSFFFSMSISWPLSRFSLESCHVYARLNCRP